MELRTFGLADEAAFRAWVESQPHAIVNFHAFNCPYANRFLPGFTRIATDLPWPVAVRTLDITSDDEWDYDDVALTPTVIAYRDGKEVSRLAARSLVGLSEVEFQRWLKALP